MSPSGSRWLPGLLLLPLALSTPARSQISLTYDPTLGTLPQSQGFVFVDQAPTAPAPAVVAGVLEQGPVAVTEMQYWIRDDVPVAFADGLEIEAELRVVSSGYVTLPQDGSQRSGFYVEVVDDTGRRIGVGVASVGITVNTDLLLMPENGIPLLAFPTQGAFHTYRVTASADSVRLFIDGIYRASAPLGPPVFSPGAPDVYFGDGTTAAGSQVDIGRVRISSDPAVVDVAAAPMRTADTLRIAALQVPSRDGASLGLRAASRVTVGVRILDVSGRLVRDLGEVEARPEGAVLRWAGDEAAGRSAAAGAYFAIATGHGRRSVCKVLLVR